MLAEIHERLDALLRQGLAGECRDQDGRRLQVLLALASGHEDLLETANHRNLHVRLFLRVCCRWNLARGDREARHEFQAPRGGRRPPARNRTIMSPAHMPLPRDPCTSGWKYCAQWVAVV